MPVRSLLCLALFLLLLCAGCGGKTTVTYRFESNPSGAEVYGDGSYLCTTPCDVDFIRDPVASISKKIYSPRSVELRKQGYKTITRSYASGWDMAAAPEYTDYGVFFSLIKKPEAPQAAVQAPATQAPRETLPGAGNRYAVVIGLSEYADSRIPRLRYAASDARAFYDWAVSPTGGRYAPANVKLLVDEQATNQNIKTALFGWLKQALAEDVVTIYFAGHGSPDSPDSPGNLYLLPHDAQYDNIAATGFPMWDIETALTRFVKARKVVVIADACHAGGVGQSFDVARRANRAVEVNPISSGLQDLSRVGDGVCVISASDDSQFSQEGEQWGGGHGVFTHYLLQGLEGEADYNADAAVTLGELIPYLSEQVRRATQNAQSPTVAGKFDPALRIGR
jgi:uncharacterized caspase-like protein